MKKQILKFIVVFTQNEKLLEYNGNVCLPDILKLTFLLFSSDNRTIQCGVI